MFVDKRLRSVLHITNHLAETNQFYVCGCRVALSETVFGRRMSQLGT